MTETEDERLQRLVKDRFERPLPKRFYKTVEVSDDHSILLDGRAVKTPLKKPLQVLNARLAAAVAAEWQAQDTHINPALMPVTKLSNTAIDRATAERANVMDEIVQYAGNDMVCYWADRPPELVALQRAHWQPVLTWATGVFQVEPLRVMGLSHQPQPGGLLSAVRGHIEALDPWHLTAAYLLTTLTGSALIALMLQARGLDGDAAWSAANVEEDYQISQWGEDWEAKIRREARARDFAGLVHFLDLLR